MGKRIQGRGEPVRNRLKDLLFPLVGESDPTGEEHGCDPCIPGAIFVITQQGISPGGKLNPDLVASAGMEADVDQTFLGSD